MQDIKVEKDSLEAFWSVGLDYYYTDYDWGLIFRQIGANETENMFFKTR